MTVAKFTTRAAQQSVAPEPPPRTSSGSRDAVRGPAERGR
jgi:hypothetical protein